jgi:hypothetical protein
LPSEDFPFAEKTRSSVLLEAFAIKVLTTCGAAKRAEERLKLDEDNVNLIMSLAVERRLHGQSVQDIKYEGMNEKSFLSGKNYISFLTDLDESRVPEVVLARTK